MRPDPSRTLAAPGTVIRRTDDKVDALAVTLVLPEINFEYRYMLVGDMLVCGNGAIDKPARHYTVDHYTPSEARRLLLGYVGDNEAEGFTMVGGVVNFTVTSHVYESVRELDDHRGPNILIHQLFHIAMHGLP